MKKVLVVGAGRVGRTLVHMIAAEPRYEVSVGDARPEVAAAAAEGVVRASAFPRPLTDARTLREALKGFQAVVSAAPYHANVQIARCAAEAGVHYLDLTEDVAVSRTVRELAKGARSAFASQCGVAPGFVSIAACHVIRQFDEVDTLTLRTGALPRQPNNRLKYNLTWSTEGLVNEYVRPCEALREGKLALVPPMQEAEEVLIDGVTYEAFTTSGGVGSLCHTYADKIRRLDYKTIRYPGHLKLMQFLLQDLQFQEHPEELVAILHRSIPITQDDVVLVSVRALGTVGGRYEERTFWRKRAGARIGKHSFTGIEIATAAGAAGVLHLLLEGVLPQAGVVRMEDVSMKAFLNTPFGAYYGHSGTAGAPQQVDDVGPRE